MFSSSRGFLLSLLKGLSFLFPPKPDPTVTLCFVHGQELWEEQSSVLRCLWNVSLSNTEELALKTKYYHPTETTDALTFWPASRRCGTWRTSGSVCEFYCFKLSPHQVYEQYWRVQILPSLCATKNRGAVGVFVAFKVLKTVSAPSLPLTFAMQQLGSDIYIHIEPQSFNVLCVTCTRTADTLDLRELPSHIHISRKRIGCSLNNCGGFQKPRSPTVR